MMRIRHKLRSRHVSLILAGVLAFTAIGCGADDPEPGTSDTPADGDDRADTDDQADTVLTDFGVTDDTISVGYITDLSGVFAPIGREYLAGSELYVDLRNREGGVCGRDLSLEVKDHGYDVQATQTHYEEISEDVLGFATVLGSAMAEQVAPSMERDEMLYTSFAWDASLLASPNFYMLGGSYEIGAINAMSWAIEEFGIEEGDTVGILTFTAAFGETTARGVKTVAEAYGLNVEEHRIEFTDTDFTGPITAFRRADAKAIMMTGTASQLASMLSTAEAQGLDANWLAPFNGSFNAALLDGPAKDMLEERWYSAAVSATWDADHPTVQLIRENYDEVTTGVEPGFGVALGYAAVAAYVEILEAACEAGDITRAGVFSAYQSMDTLDAEGLLVPLDLTRPAGSSQSLVSYMVKPDSSVEGGLTRVSEDFVSDVAKESGL